MIFFNNDYSEGALPQVMEALVRTNNVSTVGYGVDAYCQEAAEKLKARFDCPDADVHFLVGGTQVNLTAISAFLRPWEAVIATSAAHIAVHETGAVEATGHKVCVADTPDGKLTPELIARIYASHENGGDEHMVVPKLVYLSDSTELGTIYSKRELAAISALCRKLNLFLYLDGARLGSALTSPGNDVKPEDLAQFCDAFYVGGTKNGLLFGEALVIVRDGLKPHFRNCIKQHGGMLAKGRLLGVQFSALLEDDLWLDAARHANQMAKKLGDGLKAMGCPFYVDAFTNQLFPIFSDVLIRRLSQEFQFQLQSAVGNDCHVVRLVTSWATTPEAVEAFLAAARP